MTAARTRLHAIRFLNASRADSRSTTDLAYLVYVGVLVAAIIGTPLVRVIAIALAQPEAVAWMTADGAQVRVAVTVAAIITVFVVVGPIRGPVLPPPFLVHLLAGTDLPYRRALARPFGVAAATTTVAGVAIAGLFAGVLGAAGAVETSTVVVMTISGGLLGVVAAVGWLAGQALTNRATFLVLVAVWLMVGAGSYAPPVALGLAALGAIAAVPALLDALDGDELLLSATRWQATQRSAAVGDIQYAAGLFRPLPSRGRAWQAVAGTHWQVFFRGDAVVAARTPIRLAFGLVGAAVGWLALASAPSGSTPWLFGAMGALLVYLALGVTTDGFRHAFDCAAMPALYGYSTRRLYLLHAAMPLLFAVGTATLGWIIAALAGLPVASGVAGIVAGVPLVVLMRATDSAKGDLPPALLLPQPTPLGDMSGIMIATWQADAVLLAAIFGGGTAWLLTLGTPVAMVLFAAAIFTTLGIQLYRRLRST